MFVIEGRYQLHRLVFVYTTSLNSRLNRWAMDTFAFHPPKLGLVGRGPDSCVLDAPGHCSSTDLDTWSRSTSNMLDINKSGESSESEGAFDRQIACFLSAMLPDAQSAGSAESM